MKNWKKVLLTVLPMTLALSFTAFAGQWHNDMNGWWYEEDDGSYLANGWYWLDGNNDGIEECYYFGNDGYMVNEHGHVDGYEVDENGAWMVNGVVQRREAQVKEQPSSDQPAPSMDSNDPAAVYLAAQQKNNALDSMDMNADYLISMSAEGMTIDMGMNLNLKMKGVKNGNLQFVSSGSMNMLGTNIPISMFYTDGYYYIDMMGEKQKQAMPMDEALAEASGNVDVSASDLSMMQDLQMRRDGENTIITYTMNAADMSGYLNAMMGESMSTAGMNLSYNIKSANGEAVINKDGYYTAQKVFVDMDMVMADPESGQTESLGCRMDINMTVNNPGQPVDFTIPSTEGYEDITE